MSKQQGQNELRHLDKAEWGSGKNAGEERHARLNNRARREVGMLKQQEQSMTSQGDSRTGERKYCTRRAKGKAVVSARCRKPF